MTNSPPPIDKQSKRLIGAGTLGLSVLVHTALLMLVGGVVLIQGYIPKTSFSGNVLPEDVTIAPTDLPALSDEAMSEPAGLEMSDVLPAAGGQVENDFEPVTSEVITSSTVSAMPQVFSSSPAAAASSGTATSSGAAGGTGTGSGMGSGKGLRIMSTVLGSAGEHAGGLVGHLYDLKQDSQKKPVSADYNAVLLDFLTRDWAVSVLKPFYQASQPMTAYQFYIPNMEASLAPAMFNVQNEVRPSQWVIHYKGNFISPRTGTYRFVGRADDVLVVRFDGQTVLDGSLSPLGSFPREPHPGTKLFAGGWIKLKAHQSYPVEVLLGERPGGFFHGILLMEEKGEDYERDAKGVTMLPLFQTSDVDIPRKLANDLPIAKKAFTGEDAPKP